MTSNIRSKLAEKFKDKTYFNKFFRQRVQDEIALGLQKLRQIRKLNQGELAELCIMKQSAISRIENADYASWNFKTLSRVAEALDSRLKVVFEKREDVIKQYQSSTKENTAAQPVGYTQAMFEPFPVGKVANKITRATSSNPGHAFPIYNMATPEAGEYNFAYSSPGGTS